MGAWRSSVRLGDGGEGGRGCSQETEIQEQSCVRKEKEGSRTWLRAGVRVWREGKSP